MKISKMDRSLGIESRLVVPRGWGREKWICLFNGYWVSFWGDENVLE